MLEIIREGVRIKTENFIVPQYKSIVFPHPKHYVQSSSPYPKKM